MQPCFCYVFPYMELGHVPGEISWGNLPGWEVSKNSSSSEGSSPEGSKQATSVEERVGGTEFFTEFELKLRVRLLVWRLWVQLVGHSFCQPNRKMGRTHKRKPFFLICKCPPLPTDRAGENGRELLSLPLDGLLSSTPGAALTVSWFPTGQQGLSLTSKMGLSPGLACNWRDEPGWPCLCRLRRPHFWEEGGGKGRCGCPILIPGPSPVEPGELLSGQEWSS